MLGVLSIATTKEAPVSEFYEGRLRNFDEFFGNLCRLRDTEEEPELPDLWERPGVSGEVAASASPVPPQSVWAG